MVTIRGPDIYLNAGSENGLTLGRKLWVQAVKGIIKDPESGAILGEDTRAIGILKVVYVQKSFSVTRIVDGCKGIKVGDRLEVDITTLR